MDLNGVRALRHREFPVVKMSVRIAIPRKDVRSFPTANREKPATLCDVCFAKVAMASPHARREFPRIVRPVIRAIPIRNAHVRRKIRKVAAPGGFTKGIMRAK